MLGFVGSSEHKIDSKGRVSIPADFKRSLEANDPDWGPDKSPCVAVVYGKTKDYLECYSIEAYKDLLTKLDKHDRGDTRDFLIHRYVTEAHIAQIDPTGRMVLPQQMREQVGFKEKAFFGGGMRTFIISREKLRLERTQKTDDWFNNLGDKDPLSLLDQISDET